MGSTASTITNTAYSLVWNDDGEEISLRPNDSREYTLRQNIKFAYSANLKYYFPTFDDWTSDKMMLQGTFFSIHKIVRSNTGQVYVFAHFDNDDDVYDVSRFFSAISPLIIDRRYIKEYRPYVHIDVTQQSTPITSRYSSDDWSPTRCPPDQFYSKSL